MGPSGKIDQTTPEIQEISSRHGGYFADDAALASLPPMRRRNGMQVIVGVAGRMYFFCETSTASASANVCIVPADNPTAGRWLRPGVTG